MGNVHPDDEKAQVVIEGDLGKAGVVNVMKHFKILDNGVMLMLNKKQTSIQKRFVLADLVYARSRKAENDFERISFAVLAQLMPRGSIIGGMFLGFPTPSDFGSSSSPPILISWISVMRRFGASDFYGKYEAAKHYPKSTTVVHAPTPAAVNKDVSDAGLRKSTKAEVEKAFAQMRDSMKKSRWADDSSSEHEGQAGGLRENPSPFCGVCGSKNAMLQIFCRECGENLMKK